VTPIPVKKVGMGYIVKAAAVTSALAKITTGLTAAESPPRYATPIVSKLGVKVIEGRY
jgi:hypothetical protein